MHTLDKDLGTVSDTLWHKISPDVGIIIATEAEKVKCALQINHISSNILQSEHTETFPISTESFPSTTPAPNTQTLYASESQMPVMLANSFAIASSK